MPREAARTNKNVVYLRRLREAGAQEVLFQLPNKTLALIDDLKSRHGLRSRSQVLLELIERGMSMPNK